jgi:hypothetical protein
MGCFVKRKQTNGKGIITTNPSEQWGRRGQTTGKRRRSRRCVTVKVVISSITFLENIMSEKVCRREQAFSESFYSGGKD